MKTIVSILIAVLLCSCSVLNEDEQGALDCDLNPADSACFDTDLLLCAPDGTTTQLDCADMLTCDEMTVGEAFCAPDCAKGSPNMVCQGNTLVFCQGAMIMTMDCGGLSCTATGGMGAECQ